MRSTSLITALVLVAASALPAAARSNVDVNINVGVPVPPPVVVTPAPPPPPQIVVPSPPVIVPQPQVVYQQPPVFVFPPALGLYVAVGIANDLFYVGGSYYLHQAGNWYRAPYYNGPWVVTKYKKLPPGLRKHRYEQMIAYRDQEYRVYQGGPDHYRGRHFKPSKEWKEHRKEERKWEKEQRKEHKKEGKKHGKHDD